MPKTYLGIDCGSVSIKFALLKDGELVDKVYLRNQGLVPTIKEGPADPHEDIRDWFPFVEL